MDLWWSCMCFISDILERKGRTSFRKIERRRKCNLFGYWFSFRGERRVGNMYCIWKIWIFVNNVICEWYGYEQIICHIRHKICLCCVYVAVFLFFLFCFSTSFLFFTFFYLASSLICILALGFYFCMFVLCVLSSAHI